MSVSVTVVGSNQDSDEYLGALRLKELLETGLPRGAIGEIILHANATLVGQTIKDIDVLMLGTLQNCTAVVDFTDPKGERRKEQVTFSSFCTAIEIKSHDAAGIVREGTEFYVRYGRELHPVTTQSNGQKIAVRNYLERSMGYSPFVSNLIWFTGITEEELKALLSTDRGVMPSNTLPAVFSAQTLLQRLAWQKELKPFRGGYFFDCGLQSLSLDALSAAFRKFTLARSAMGALTRKRIEQITTNTIKSSVQKPGAGKLSIYRGRAGTGKTVGLVQLAISLVDEEDARVLILTYNHALVSDLRRLFTLAELPDLFSPRCVSIYTMHSFFYRLANETLFNGALEGGRFLEDYETILKELLDFLEGGEEALDLIREVMQEDIFLNWDYCMIDEAQDWLRVEQKIILKLFPAERIVVADGGQQFVRRIEAGDWSSLPNRNSTRLKYCLRQKSNLIRFTNRFLDALDMSEHRLSDPGKLAGGRVVVCGEGEGRFRVFAEELEKLKAAGNIPYDMLFLVPACMVEREPRRFAGKSLYASHGFFLWDGTNEETRRSFSQLGDEERVLQYDSARGLEAWTVVCVALDRFLEEKEHTPAEAFRQDSLYLESAEDTRRKNLVNWLLIPLTRAIDTVVITISDWASPTAGLLRKLAEENPDYICLMEENGSWQTF